MDRPWRIEMLGWLRAAQGEQVVSRFRTRNAGALLAYLAYYRDRSHPREELIERYWPEAGLNAGRHNLSMALSSLRRQLEPPGVPSGAVIVADRDSVRLNPVACVTDVGEFEASLKAAARAGSHPERVQRLEVAVELYRGELLPGYFDEWIEPERHWLGEAFLRAMGQLIDLLEQEGDLSRALPLARRVVAAEPLREQAHRDLMRLLVSVGQPEAALRQFRELERLLEIECGASPSPESCELADAIAAGRDGGSAKGGNGASRPPLPGDQPCFEPPFPAPSSKTAGGEAPRSSASAGRTGSLPLQFTRFFGRETEIARLMALLTESGATKMPGPGRLVTITGTGGSGKTRLALEVAQRLRDQWEDAVWFVPLADLVDPDLIPNKALAALRLTRSPRLDALDQLVDALSSPRCAGNRHGLLLLDNLEHLIAGGTEIVRVLLERVRGLTLLATSRQRLGLDGEQEFPVGPLPVPGVRYGVSGVGEGATNPNTQHLTPHTLLQFPSVQLFVDRAQAVRPDFQVTRRTVGTIAALCDRLEGLPLALELVAARAGVLAPAQMLARVEHRFELSVSRRRDAAPRHRSLRAALDWSYHLLLPELQRFFACLSIFRGGWTLDAAEAVCEAPRALEYLQQLRECSLVLCHEAGEEMRYRLLETLREYGAEQLEPQERVSLARRHAEYYLALTERAEACLISADQKQWLDRLEAELENLRAVLDWSESESGAVEIGLRLGGALRWFWGRGGHLREGRERLSRLLARVGEARTPERAKAQACAGAIAQALGAMEEARSLLTEALAIARECNASSEMAYSLRFLGHLAVFRSDYAEASAFLEESRSISQAAGNQWETADCLNLLGHVARYQGDYVTARSFFEETLALLRCLGDRSGTATLLKNLSIIARYQGEYGAARTLAEESLAIGRAMGDRPGVALALLTLGGVLEEQGDLEAARAYYEESLAIRRELCIPYGVAWSLGLLGRVALAQGEAEEARSLYQESLEMRRDLGDRRGIAECLEGLAAVARAADHLQQSARLFGAAQALRDAIGSMAPPRERREQQRQLAALREAMGETSYLAAWNAGRALNWQQAAAEALPPSLIATPV